MFTDVFDRFIFIMWVTHEVTTRVALAGGIILNYAIAMVRSHPWPLSGVYINLTDGLLWEQEAVGLSPATPTIIYF